MNPRNNRTRQDPAARPSGRSSVVSVLESTLESFLDVLPDPFFAVDASGNILKANRQAETLFGWKQEELVGQSINILMPHEEAQSHGRLMRDYASRGHGHLVSKAREIQAKRKDGSLFPAELTVSEIHGADGFGFIAVVQDRSQYATTLKALNDSQERFALAMSGTHEGIWDWNVGTGLVFITERIRELFRVEKNIGTAHEWLHCIHPDDRERYVACLKDHLRGKTEFFSIDYRMAGDDIRWVRHRGLGLRDETGRVFRMAGSVGDITEAKLAEAKLKETLAQAEAANKAKSDFLAAMSHELRTPLNAIIGFSEMIHGQMLGPVGTPKYGEYAGDIMASARHLLDIINDILEMARMDAGQAEYRPEPVAMGSVIDASLRLLHQRISHSGLSLVTKLFPELPTIMGDERRLKQVMINLLGNAIKFTPQGGSIVVEAKPVLDGRLMIRVIDSGIGIAERDIPRALAPFTQVDSVVARRYQGSGLGLSLAKAFVELHGGNLELSSILGKGTTVTLYFPLPKAV